MLKLSPDEAALLKAVCADRDSDLPRLVYADWLDDHGRPERAEFIRLQCEFHRLDPEQTRLTNRQHLKRHELRDRIEELLAAHRRNWSRELPRWACEWCGDDEPSFVRGFVEALDISASGFVRYAPQVLDRSPIRRLSLRHTAAVWAEVVGCGWLREVPEVEVWAERLLDENGVAMCRADWLVGTRQLNLRGNNLRDATARALAGCRQLSRLEHLNLAQNELTMAGVRALAGSELLVQLRVLDLSWNPHLGNHLCEVQRLFAGRLDLRIEDTD